MHVTQDNLTQTDGTLHLIWLNEFHVFHVFWSVAWWRHGVFFVSVLVTAGCRLSLSDGLCLSIAEPKQVLITLFIHVKHRPVHTDSVTDRQTEIHTTHRHTYTASSELVSIITMRGTYPYYRRRVRSTNSVSRGDVIYSSETWAMRVEDMQKLKRTEAVWLHDACSCVASLQRSICQMKLWGEDWVLDCVSDLVRLGRLRWV